MASKTGSLVPEVLSKIIEAQEEALEFAREHGYQFDYETWLMFRRLLPEGTKFLSARTLRLLQLAENYGLWCSRWAMRRLCFAIEQDNNELRRIWVLSLRLVAEVRERPRYILSVDQPIDFLEAVRASTRPGRRGPETRGSRGRARGEDQDALEGEIQEGEGKGREGDSG